jgi:hypothetical protein
MAYRETAAGALKPRARLIAENVCLRQQLVVLKRRQKRPSLRDADRRFWILASRWFGRWREMLLVVQPETVKGTESKRDRRTMDQNRAVRMPGSPARAWPPTPAAADRQIRCLLQ